MEMDQVPASSSTSTTNSFTISTVTRTLDIQFEDLVHKITTGYIKRGKQVERSGSVYI